MPNETEKPEGPRAKVGRRIALVAYVAFAGFLATASVWQITRHVFFPVSREIPTFSSCGAGLQALYQAIEHGRAAAESGPEAGEEAALLRYRETVAPAWRYRDAVERLCSADPKEITVLDAIERLRYSEEHSVRHQAVELSALRRNVKELVARSGAR